MFTHAHPYPYPANHAETEQGFRVFDWTVQAIIHWLFHSHTHICQMRPEPEKRVVGRRERRNRPPEK